MASVEYDDESYSLLVISTGQLILYLFLSYWFSTQMQTCHWDQLFRIKDSRQQQQCTPTKSQRFQFLNGKRTFCSPVEWEGCGNQIVDGYLICRRHIYLHRQTYQKNGCEIGCQYSCVVWQHWCLKYGGNFILTSEAASCNSQ